LLRIGGCLGSGVQCVPRWCTFCWCLVKLNILVCQELPGCTERAATSVHAQCSQSPIHTQDLTRLCLSHVQDFLHTVFRGCVLTPGELMLVACHHILRPCRQCHVAGQKQTCGRIFGLSTPHSMSGSSNLPSFAIPFRSPRVLFVMSLV